MITGSHGPANRLMVEIVAVNVLSVSGFQLHKIHGAQPVGDKARTGDQSACFFVGGREYFDIIDLAGNQDAVDAGIRLAGNDGCKAVQELVLLFR
jgi:hypothetical protein